MRPLRCVIIADMQKRGFNTGISDLIEYAGAGLLRILITAEFAKRGGNTIAPLAPQNRTLNRSKYRRKL